MKQMFPSNQEKEINNNEHKKKRKQIQFLYLNLYIQEIKKVILKTTQNSPIKYIIYIFH